METHTKTFENEIGNSIRVEVAEKDISGVKGISIFMAGPDSDATLHTTRREAEVLYELLGRALGMVS